MTLINKSLASLLGVWRIALFTLGGFVSDRGRFFQTFPSILIGMAAIAAILLASTQPARQVEARYLDAAYRALERLDLAAAELYFLRVAQFHEDDDRALAGLAEVAMRKEDHPRAARLMQRLASQQRRGPVSAHLWLAKEVLRREGTRTPEEMATVEAHLLHVLDRQPEHKEALSLLSAQLLATGRSNDAIPYLETLSKANPESGFHLGIAYRNAKNLAASKLAFESAKAPLEQIAKTTPDNMGAQLRLAQCHFLLGEFEAAKKVVLDRFQRTQQPEYRTEYIKFLISEADTLWLGETKNTKRALVLLANVMTFDPGNPDVLQRWTLLASSPGEERDEIKKLLKQLLAEGKSTAGVHFTLGTIALIEQDYQVANQHLDLGLKEEPNMVSVLNNYAYSLAFANPPQLEQALLLANRALAIRPNQAEVLETRGQILTKLERWEDAIADLEKALPSMPGNAKLRESLVQAYSAIGRDDIADVHRSLLKAQEAKSMDKVQQ